jgi:hypothetical protein
MTTAQADASVRRLYWLTLSFGLFGFVSYWIANGFRIALAFLLGAGVSFGNLWLFSYLSRAIAPASENKSPENKTWSARSFISRYLLLFAGGYAITKGLDADPLMVVLGLFVSTAAVLVSSIVDLFSPASH